MTVVRTKRRERVLAAMALSLGCLASLVVSEAFLRWWEHRLERKRMDAPPPVQMMEANPSGAGSFRLRPNLRLDVGIKGHTVRVETNRFGMRWPDVALQKAPRKRRIAVLGDSFAFGAWSSTIEKSFVGVLQGGLPKRFEVLNFGVGGYGLDDEELLLRERVVDFAPDYVIVALFNGNDFRDTYLGLRKHRVEQGVVNLDEANVEALVPAQFVERDDTVSLPAEDPWLLRRALTRLVTFRYAFAALGWDNPWLDFKVSRRVTTFTFWSRLPQPEIILRARDETLATLDRMNARVRERGALLGVVAIPFRDQVYASTPSGADFDTDFPQAYVKVHCRERGIPFLDLLPPLRQRVIETRDPLYLREDIHFNDSGHALVGSLVRQWFLTAMAPQGPEDAR